MMKNRNRIVLLLSFIMTFSLSACAQAKTDNPENNNSEIHWLTFEQAEQKMKEKPKKVLVDIYTSWCGWCKVMEKKTYSNPQLIKYVNEHFYAVKFNAEQKTPIHFMGKEWDYVPANRANKLAIQLMQGKMSYPTSVFMGENFTDPQPVPGYMEVYQMEGILKFIGEGINKKMPWKEYQHSFKPEWQPKQ